VIILENDLYRRARPPPKWIPPRCSAHVIVLDHLADPTTEKAELVLPAATFAESDGTFVSSEGRTQRFFQAFIPQNDISPSWRWLAPDHWQSWTMCLRKCRQRCPAGSCVLCRAAGRLSELRAPRSPVHRIAKAPHCNAR